MGVSFTWVHHHTTNTGIGIIYLMYFPYWLCLCVWSFIGSNIFWRSLAGAASSRAAEVCNISQPSLSQQIKKLENEVGGQLILRSRDGVCLSELGQSFLPYARDMMHAVESAWDFVDESHQKVTGRVRIGAIPTIAPYLLPTILKHLRSDYPDVQYEVVEETTNLLIDKLRQGEIDFAILSPPTKVDPDVEHVDLCEDELMLTLPLDHSLNKEKVLDIGSLKDEKLLLLKETHCLSQQSKSFAPLSIR